jgi:hypothetical protein
MDLSGFEIKDDDVAIMQVKHPVTDAPLMENEKPVTISFVSEDSERFRGKRRQVINRRLRNRKNSQVTYTAELAESDALDALCDATVAWEGIGLDGEELPCSPENAKKVFRRLPWLVEQADLFVTDRANFLRASSKS